MVFVNSLFFLVHFVTVFGLDPNLNYIYPTESYFEQKLDHFNPLNDSIYKQRLFVSTQYWDKASGPIFFYTGNEGNVESFINNTGFMWDIAPIYKALVVFAEHRFYGKSNPYGDLAPSADNKEKFAQFTAEQALADYAVLITHLKDTLPGAKDAAVVAFGGSYGGMLSAWFRMKYSNVVDGAIAGSAPVRYFPGHVDCSSYNQVVTTDYSEVPGNGSNCVKNIRRSFGVIKAIAAKPDGLKQLTETFKLCHDLKSADVLSAFIQDSISSTAMVDYPYPATFLGPMPPWPVNVTCDAISTPDQSDEDLLADLHRALGVSLNYTGDQTCIDLEGSPLGSNVNTLWGFQTCTEMVMPFCANGITDMFPPSTWTEESWASYCMKAFGTVPRPNWAILNFGGSDLQSASNIVFSNGELDPWHVGGILSSPSSSAVSILIHSGAHHLDLRHSNPADPKSVVNARQMEMANINSWIKNKQQKKVPK